MNLLYANSGADFCQHVVSISRLTPWWWKVSCGKAIPVFSNPAGAVQQVPLANLRPTVEGKCSEECDGSCNNLHANSTPYWHRGWCRAEMEWSSPAIRDISYGALVSFVAKLLLFSILLGFFLGPPFLFVDLKFGKWACVCTALGIALSGIVLMPCLQGASGPYSSQEPKYQRLGHDPDSLFRQTNFKSKCEQRALPSLAGRISAKWLPCRRRFTNRNSLQQRVCL